MNIKIFKCATFEDVQEYEIQKDDGPREPLSYTDHDMQGWSGMESARDLVERFAEIFGIKIEEDEWVDEPD